MLERPSWSKGWLLLALLYSPLTFAVNGNTSTCYPPSGNQYFNTAGEALAACLADCVDGQNDQTCVRTDETSSFAYYRWEENGPANQWGTGYVFPGIDGCPVGDNFVSPGVCDGSGGGSSSGGGGSSSSSSSSSSGGGTVYGSCNFQEAIAAQEAAVSYPVAPDSLYSKAQLSQAQLQAGEVDLQTTVTKHCVPVPGLTSAATEETLHCLATDYIVQQLDSDMNITTTSYSTLQTAGEVDASSYIGCGQTTQGNNTANLGDYASTTTDTNIDDLGNTTVETESCLTTRNYSSTTGTTEVCDVCTISVNGGPSSLTSTCMYEAGDTTNEQTGDSGSGTVDSNGNLTGGTPGTVVGTGGTGTDSDGNTTGSGGTGDNAELISAINDLKTAIEEQEIGGCDDPNGCEDFAEIIEDFDVQVVLNDMTTSLTSVTDFFSSQESELTTVAGDPGGLVDGGVTTTGIEGLGGWISVGNCTDVSYALPGNFPPFVIECDDLLPIKTLLTLAFNLMLLVWLRDIWMRPSSAPGG